MAKDTLLVADDNRIDSWFLRQHLSQKGYAVDTVALQQLLPALKTSAPDVLILSFRFIHLYGHQALAKLREVHKQPVIILLLSHHEIAQGRMTRKLGVFDYILRPYNMDEIDLVIRKAVEAARSKRHVINPNEKKTDRFGFHYVIGRSPAFTRIIELARKVAKSETSTVLLQGESGTGKDVLAKAIHFESERYRAPFVEITCSALPEALLESELFGHERGSFTDAKGRKEGLFLLAESGTVFLNEIGDMSLTLQAKILRLIEQKTFRMVGGNKDVQVDVRIIAATCVDLKRAVERGAFRLDLYYRLNVVPITIPPLRERREDILPLAEYFIDEYNRTFHRAIEGFSSAAQSCLERYTWPGNVRELRNVIERIMILENVAVIEVAHLPPELIAEAEQPPVPLPSFALSAADVSLAEAEEKLIKHALERCNHNLSKAARMLNIGRDALRYRVKKLGLVAS